MRFPLALPLLVLATPALAQFPPPGVYDCKSPDGTRLGTLSLLAGGDYQWDTAGATSGGQVASSGSTVDALTGVLADQHWQGSFLAQMDRTMFSFETDAGPIVCE